MRTTKPRAIPGLLNPNDMKEQNNFRVICLESAAFYELLSLTVEHIERKFNLPVEEIWISGDDAMSLLNVRPTTLKALRDTGKIRFSTAGKKNLVYDRLSIVEYLNSNAKNTF